MSIVLQTITLGLSCCSLTCLQHSIPSTNSTFLRRLDHTYGVRGTSREWVDSYLDERSQYVELGDGVSSSVSCHCGVPQGSVLVPCCLPSTPRQLLTSSHPPEMSTMHTLHSTPTTPNCTSHSAVTGLSTSLMTFPVRLSLVGRQQPLSESSQIRSNRHR